jgi:hypothetical protein
MKSLSTAVGMYQSQFNTTPATNTVLYTTGDCKTAPAVATASCMLPFSTGSAMFAATGLNGYVYTFALDANGSTFQITGTPVAGGAATRSYWGDGTILTYADTGAAGSTSTPLGN